MSVMRCPWPGENELYIRYHDEEWGVPVHDDRLHFEFLVLEGAQAGLSWITILKRRDGYRRAYHNFDVQAVANFGQMDVDRLLQDPGIIRNRLKVQSSIRNAQAFIAIQKEFDSFDTYIWRFVHGQPVVRTVSDQVHVPARTDLSDVVSADLKKRGMSFVGSTIMYAHLQATGLVNDHLVSCFRHPFN